MTAARIGAGIVLLLAAGRAGATLGEPAATVDADGALLKGSHRVAQSQAARLQVHTITLADGSAVREYVAPSGIVFAVAWSTRLKPRLETLLGSHAPAYAAAASAALARPGVRHGVSLSSGDLVVQASAHLNAHAGLAYLKSLVPDGVRIDELH
ncbi:MAG TPA: DUF2844 domain-containing protein [Burkholderiaceae bacterium]